MITEKLNDAIEKRDRAVVRRKREPGKYYPSCASVSTPNGVEGTCLRKEFYSIKGEVPTNPTTAESIRIMSAGKRAEEFEIEAAAAAGILKDSQKKFQHILPSGITISGALDGIFTFDGKTAIIEYKSIYGEYARDKVLGIDKWGNPTTIPPYPKSDHLLQSMLYLDHFKSEISELYIIYVDRGNGKSREYLVTLDEEGHGCVASPEPLGVTSFTVADIYTRFDELEGFVKKDELPPRDFTNSYWLCKSYCNFRDKCKKEPKNVSPRKVTTGTTDNGNGETSPTGDDSGK